MECIRQLQSAGHAVFFTIDAGPQVKAICLPGESEIVRTALAACDGVIRTMVSGLGPGAQLLDSH
jgi:diphosphomevalonate decarboxylase